MDNYLDQFVKAYQGNNIYDFDNQIMLSWYPNRVIEYAKSKNSMLELGLGHGITTRFFENHFMRYVVLDGSPAVIKNFKEKFNDTKAEIVEVFFEDFQTDESFDVINFGFILEHIDNPVYILKRFKKFLKPDGKIFISVPNAESMNRRLGKITGDLKDFSELSENDLLLGHKRYYTVNTLLTDIKAAGLEVSAVEGIYLKPFATRQIQSLGLSTDYINALCVLGIKYPELSCGILVVAHLKDE